MPGSASALSLAGRLTRRTDGADQLHLRLPLRGFDLGDVCTADASDAGAEMAGHIEAGREVTEPKVETRPQV